MTNGAALLGTAVTVRSQVVAAAQLAMPAAPVVAPATPPGGYNILFILVDQEHFFDKWPMPVPGREWIKQNGITFTNHQAASCVCSPARSTIYTGEHIQYTAIFDNANSLWQADMSTDVKTIGHRMAELGYHAAYQGKWHLSVNLDQVQDAIDAPFADYRRIIESYGFEDFSASAISTIRPSAATITTTRPPPSSSAGCAPRARRFGRKESPGISR